MASRSKSRFSRRSFLGKATAGSALALSTPTLLTAKKTDKSTVVGVEGHQYEVQHMWPKLPDRFNWQTTHNVAFDSQGLLYVIHEGRVQDNPDRKDTIFVFDDQGKYVRSFGEEFVGGGHGIEIRNEAGQDYLYVCAYQEQRSFAKLDMQGEIVWRKGAPLESGFYAEGEQLFPRDDNPWGRDRFLPTNIAFLDDGGFFLADGYGTWRIHRYDKDANWLSSFGKPAGEDRADGTFHLPHGIWIDRRGAEPMVVVADRVLKRLQWFNVAGEHQQTLDGFLLPANIDIHGDTMVVPDLVGRVTLLDRDNQVIAQLGDDSERMAADSKLQIRQDESKWQDGKFVHPHDACFDHDGNLFVAEWVQRGRVTKLRKLS
ncbi:MAG: hypothetical protein AAGD11_04825 [Planctomycetota bacterium]